MGSGMAEGENRSLEAVQMAMTSPLLDDANIRGASNILLYISSGTEEITLDEVMEITDYIQHEAGSGADIIWGNGTDESLGNKISITLIATGFDSKNKTDGQTARPDVIVYPLDSNPVQPPKPVDQPRPEPAPVEEIRLINKVQHEESKELNVVNSHSDEVAEPQRTFTFEINQVATDGSAAGIEDKPAENFVFTPVKPVRHSEPGFDFLRDYRTDKQKATDDEDELMKQDERASIRLAKLREVSIKVNTPEGLAELENQPAYLRRNVELRDTPPSDSSEVSKYMLFKNENKSVEMKPNNFLHDNVD
jgi:cell division protein FtsZ